MREVLRIYVVDNGAVVVKTEWGDPAADGKPCTPCQKRAQVTKVSHTAVLTTEKLYEAVDEALLPVKFGKDCGCG